AIRSHVFIDKLSSVIRIDPQNGKRKERAGALQGREHLLSSTVEQRETFRPPSGHIREGQRIKEVSFKVRTAMGYQVDFQKTRFGLIPVLKGTNGDVLFQQRSSFRRG